MWPTAKDVINQAARQLGLATADLDDPWASRDANYLQLVALLQALGDDLAQTYDWSHLQKTHTFDTVAGQDTYTLPTDFGRILDATGWDRTNARALEGPVGAIGWQALQGQRITPAIGTTYRMVGTQLELSPTPTGVATLALEYISAWWVAPSGQTTPTTDTVSAATNTLYFGRRLLVAGLRLAFLEAKGFDTTAAAQAYTRALADARAADGGAPVLRLDGRGFGAHRLINWANVPDTGFGE